MILALTTSRKILKTVTSRCGVMAQWLGILAALPKDPHGCSRPSVTAAPEEVMPPSDLCWHQTHTWDTDILAGKILVHIKKERAVKKKKKDHQEQPQCEEKQKWWEGWRGQERDKLKRNQDVSEWKVAQEWSTHHVSGSYVLVKVPISRMIRSEYLSLFSP